MAKIKTAIRLLKYSPRGFLKALFDTLNKRGFLQGIGDISFLRMAYWLRFGERLNLDNPQNFNEKLQWLKLFDHRQEYITLVDKIVVKEFVANRIGLEYVIPTLGVWEHPEDIEWDKLPNQFVLKWNHDSGSIIICRDKHAFNKDKAISKLRHGEKMNGYWYGREWPYKGVKPLLFAEKYMEDSVTKELRDYKVFTFDGKAKMLLVASDRQKKGEEVKFDFYDTNKTHLNIKNDHPNAIISPQLPSLFDTIIELAEMLSSGYPHLRVDFYEVDGRVYFGEFTFYHGSGLMSFMPNEWNERMGSWLTLPEKRL